MAFAVIFYCLTLINPGYVPAREDFIQVLQKMLQESLHLDYLCIQCENLRPEKTRHCNYCNKCVQGFDHHCTFVNNCIGYRNHKYFILFLVFFFVYLISLIAHSIVALVLFFSYSVEQQHEKVEILKASINLFIVFVVLLHSPVLLLQFYSQCKKLSTDSRNEDAAEDDATTEVSIDFEREKTPKPAKSCVCWQNNKALWAYKP
jgi:DHHC palmitoyltransferase